MSLFETEAIILKTYSLSEADKIVVFLTEKQGLVRGVAKGAKRLKSKFGGSLEPFTVTYISYFQKEERELVSIRQIELVKSYFEIVCEPYVLEKFSYLVDLIVEFAPPHDPNEKLYRMVKVCLEKAAQSPEFIDSVILYFEFWLLRLAGFLPNWETCSICKRQFTLREKAFLQTDFHLFCVQCRKSDNHNVVNSGLRFIHTAARKYTPDNFIQNTADRAEAISELSVILKKMLSRILNREVSDKKILIAHT